MQYLPLFRRYGQGRLQKAAFLSDYPFEEHFVLNAFTPGQQLSGKAIFILSNFPRDVKGRPLTIVMASFYWEPWM